MLTVNTYYNQYGWCLDQHVWERVWCSEWHCLSQLSRCRVYGAKDVIITSGTWALWWLWLLQNMVLRKLEKAAKSLGTAVIKLWIQEVHGGKGMVDHSESLYRWQWCSSPLQRAKESLMFERAHAGQLPRMPFPPSFLALQWSVLLAFRIMVDKLCHWNAET